MGLLIDAKEYGFRKSDIVVLYKKKDKWKIYGQGTYYGLRLSKPRRFIDELIEEVMSEKRVKRENVKIGKVTDLIVEEIGDNPTKRHKN
jgi:ribosomal protein L20A (L18A)